MIGLLAAVEESGYFSRLVMVGHVPVIVFSSSEKPQDKSVFNQLEIEYFTKPSSINNRGQIVHHEINVCG